jgi:hypothetical protein
MQKVFPQSSRNNQPDECADHPGRFAFREETAHEQVVGTGLPSAERTPEVQRKASEKV